MAGVQQITLERDGHDQPWGFRLQGGHDVGIPLSIQRVLVGTPAEGVLKKGDIIIKIGNTDAKALGHQQAADLFTNTGNQIQISIKRPGGSGLQTAHIVNASPAIAPPHNVPVTGGIALPGLGTVSAGKNPEALLTNLPKSRMAPSHQPLTTSTSAPLTIQNQPYRTSPLIQPSAKIDIGPGSAQHLKMQADHITGAKEALLSPDSQHSRAAEFSMQQKVRRHTLNPIHCPSPGNERKLGRVENNKTNHIKEAWNTENSHNYRYPVWRNMFNDLVPRSRKTERDFSTNRNKSSVNKDVAIAKMGKLVFMIGDEIVELKQIPPKKKRLSDPGKQLEVDLKPFNRNKHSDELGHLKMGRLSLRTPEEFNWQYLNNGELTNDFKRSKHAIQAGKQKKKAPDVIKTKDKIDSFGEISDEVLDEDIKGTSQIANYSEFQNTTEVADREIKHTFEAEAPRLQTEIINGPSPTKALPVDTLHNISFPSDMTKDSNRSSISQENSPSQNIINKNLFESKIDDELEIQNSKNYPMMYTIKGGDDQSISFTIKLKNNLPKPIITYESINVQKTVQIQNCYNR